MKCTIFKLKIVSVLLLWNISDVMIHLQSGGGLGLQGLRLASQQQVILNENEIITASKLVCPFDLYQEDEILG
jgi:hypothetical protein